MKNGRKLGAVVLELASKAIKRGEQIYQISYSNLTLMCLSLTKIDLP